MVWVHRWYRQGGVAEPTIEQETIRANVNGFASRPAALENTSVWAVQVNGPNFRVQRYDRFRLSKAKPPPFPFHRSRCQHRGRDRHRHLLAPLIEQQGGDHPLRLAAFTLGLIKPTP